MKDKGKIYRNLFIVVLVLLIIAALAYRYFPFSKIIRVTASKELAQIGPVKTGSEPPNSIAYDFEIARGTELPNGIVTGNAHSGQYSAKAFGKNSFTPALERLAGDLGTGKLRYIAISAWVFVKPGAEPVTAALVLAASNAMGVNLCWKGIGLKDPGVPRGKWFKMSGQFDLSDVKFANDTRVQMYFWNNSSTDIYIDDYYLVYGGPSPRRGDTTYVDLTKGPYQEKFNYPPFPVSFMWMATIGGINGSSLANGGDGRPEPVLPSDPMICGNFIPGNSGRDVLFDLTTGGKPFIYAFCPEPGSFRRSAVEIPVAMPSVKGKQYLLRGKFIKGENEQLLYLGEKSCFLYKFNCKGGACREGSTVTAELLWESEKFENLDFDSGRPLLAEDLDGDGISEILYSSAGGIWKMFRFQLKGKTGSWGLSAESKENLEDWSGTAGAVKLTAGHFIPGRTQAGILAVSEKGRKHGCSYTLRFYNPSVKNFISFFSQKNGLPGKIKGIDTLRVSEIFICGNFGENSSPMVMRYNRDWRFDLKQIAFSDSTYHILNDIDFAGYASDHNPKYYEVLKLIPGRFTGNQASLLVIGRNCRSRDYNGKECDEYENLPELPDFISVYSFVKP